jgi:lysozyme family protein
MEGGFTDDPDDPGGPTNKGIILRVFCDHTRRTLNDFTRRSCVEALRAIPDDMVSEIYRQRYWTPSRAEEMPVVIGLMHFDASVNQGLAGAARLLQRAVRRQVLTIEVDGEIGPLTMKALAAAEIVRLLSDYANERRRHYRALHHFWKFGRGWLNRVDRTEKRARSLLGSADERNRNKNPAKGHDVTTIESTGVTSKWWGSSMTIWGAAITALSTVVPILGPAIGLEVTPDVVRQAGEQFVTVIQAIGGLIGTIMTIYGRTRATHALVRRQVQVQI